MFLSEDDHAGWMSIALREAEKAAAQNEVPVGAVVVHKGHLIGRGYNRTEGTIDPTAHAEIVAIGAAAQALGSWRLTGATLYVTLEPCHMCAGAIVLARLDRLVFGATDPKGGACVSLGDVVRDPRFNHKVEVIHGIMEKESGGILEEFFRAKREKKTD